MCVCVFIYIPIYLYNIGVRNGQSVFVGCSLFWVFKLNCIRVCVYHIHLHTYILYGSATNIIYESLFVGYTHVHLCKYIYTSQGLVTDIVGLFLVRFLFAAGQGAVTGVLNVVVLRISFCSVRYEMTIDVEMNSTSLAVSIDLTL